MKEYSNEELDKDIKYAAFKHLDACYERSQVVVNPVQFAARQQALLEALADYVVECARQENGVVPLNSSESLHIAHHQISSDQLDS